MLLIALSLLSLLTVAVVCASWYWIALRHNRRRALQVLRWIEVAVAGQGQASGIRWMARSRFKVPLRLHCGVFHRAWLLVDLTPCEMPLRWLLSKTRGRNEVLTFQADLDLPPSFSMEVHNLRWFARSSRKSPARRTSWSVERTGPFVISTRRAWPKEISSAMTSVAKGENREFLNVNFQPRSPHFSVTLPLESIAPGSPNRGCMFETMRELAARSSTSLS
jgi:hypothetical protein